MTKMSFAFINCTVIDGTLNGDPIEDAVVLLERTSQNPSQSGIIKEVGSKGIVKVPRGYSSVDLAGKFLLPGLINAHVHLMGDGKPKQRTSGRNLERLIRFSKTSLGKRIFLRLMRQNLENSLNSGVTTVRSMGEPFHYETILRKQIEEGVFVGPRLITAGRGICASGGHGASIFLIADSPYEGRRAVRINLREGADFIKMLNTGGVSDARRIGEAGQVQMTLEEIEAVCDEAHRAGSLVAAHAESKLGVKEALLGGADTIEHGSEIDEEMVRLFKNNEKSLRGYTALIPTFSAFHGIIDNATNKKLKWSSIQIENAKKVLEGVIEGFQTAIGKGINVGLGTDAFVPFVTHYNAWKELEYFVRYGNISNKHAIHIGTLGTAQILGVERNTGSIETGKSADFMVVNEDPLKNLATLSTPSMVCRSGIIIKKPRIRKVKGVD